MKAMYLLLTVCAVILQIAQSADPKCTLESTKLICVGVNNEELIENIKKYQPAEIKCYDGPLTKLNLQELSIDDRKKIKEIVVVDLVNELELPVDTFNGVENLEVLAIVNTTVKIVEKKMFEPLTKLKEFHFVHSHSRKRGDGHLGFKFTPDLRKLTIKGSPMYAIMDNGLFNVPNLEELDFSDATVGTIKNDSFKFLTKLKKVNLRRNGLKNLPIELFDNQPNLKVLDVSHNPLQNVDEFLPHILETNKELDEFLIHDLPCQSFETKKEALQNALNFVTECAHEGQDGPYGYKTSCVSLRAFDKRKPNEKITVFHVDGNVPVDADDNFNGVPCVSNKKFKDIFPPIPFIF
ncbi:leucine-rich repeat-containing protein 4C-like [Chrysoperla carnea]|uniref:leucine-rich repeat-containing protein 4C-like n=1 Tax=Chrysoperla carnea TaxID=189513 RepID=UPI001D070A7A|nr:leucine-rich repeat-containing protein 4C-like [Chrysoperla carnea]